MTDCVQRDTGKPDTGIATLWFSCNYGAILTTYALYRLLEEMGKRPVLLDYAPLHPNARYMEEDNISRRFMRKHRISYTEPLKNDGDYDALNNSLDTFIIGSDQVWRWRYTACCGLAYFLDYVRGDKRKVAFASSFGIETEERPAESVQRATCCLQAFDAVSVREKSGVDILREHYGIEGEWVLDPVFLCRMEDYDTLCECAEPLESPYVLSYVLEPDDAIRHHIAAISAECGAQAVNMVDAQVDFEEMQRRFGSGQIARDVSPEQWVRNIRDCDFFITDSFHGVCYALMFNRPFLCVAPPERGRTRFDSLLGLVGLQRCMLSPDYTEEEWNAAVAPIDWAQVNGILQGEREKARTWLENALNAQRSAWRVALGTLVYEKLYAGMSEKTRFSQQETELQLHVRNLLTRKLPAILRLKRLWHRAWMYATIGRARARHAARLQELRSVARHLERRNSRTFRQYTRKSIGGPLFQERSHPRTHRAPTATQNPCKPAHGLVSSVHGKREHSPLVSIIMPAHNAEKHIRGTLDCILGQTCSDWELLCVENSSTDGTRAVLDEYAAKDSRIHVMEQEPPGAGLARNAGIESARGKYLCFVDADDTYYPNMLEALATAAEKHSADLVLAAAETTSDPLDKPENRQHFDAIMVSAIRKRIKGQGVCLREELQDDVLLISNAAAWGKLYLTSFVNRYGIRFHSCRYSEDVLFTFRALALSERAAVVDTPLLCYKIWEDSLSHKEESDYEVQMGAFRDLLSSLQQQGMPQYVIMSARKRFVQDLCWFLHILSPEAKFSLRERYMREIEPDFQIFADQHLPALRGMPQWENIHGFMTPKVRFLVHPPMAARQLGTWWDSLETQICPWYEVVCFITGEEPPATMDFLHKKALGCDWFFVSDNYWQTPHAGNFRVIHIKERGMALHPLASIRAVRGEPASRLVRHGAVHSILSPRKNPAGVVRFTLFNRAFLSIFYDKLDNSVTYRIAGIAIKKSHWDIPEQFAETTEVEEY